MIIMINGKIIYPILNEFLLIGFKDLKFKFEIEFFIQLLSFLKVNLVKPFLTIQD